MEAFWIVTLVCAAFLAMAVGFFLGMYVANSYHRDAERRVGEAVEDYRWTMERNFELSMRQRQWNAGYVPNLLPGERPEPTVYERYRPRRSHGRGHAA